jgi:hypothetical protein
MVHSRNVERWGRGGGGVKVGGREWIDDDMVMIVGVSDQGKWSGGERGVGSEFGMVR